MSDLADELERLAGQMSPGPWSYDPKFEMFVGHRYAVVRPYGEPLITGIAGATSWNAAGETPDSRTLRTRNAADAEAIALLRNNLPAILRKLRGEPDAGEVERAAAVVTKARMVAPLSSDPGAAEWDRQIAERILRAARSRP